MTSITANLENVGVYLTRSSPVLSEYHYESVTESSSMLYLPDNCLKLGGASKLSMDSDIVLPPVRLLTDFIPNGGSAGSQQLFSVSKTAQDLIDDYLEQETNPSRPVTVYPKRKTKVNQESQPDIDVTPSSHKSSIHILDHSIDSSPKCNVSESKAVDAATILPTDHYRAEARTTQNEASKNRGHVKAKAAASSSKSITHRDQSRSYVPRCHKHTWVSNSRSQPFLDQSDSTGCSSLDVTAAAKSLGEALAAKLQSLLYSGTSNHKCNCECSCQPSVGEESGTSRNKLMNDKQNGKNNCPGALCYKSPSQKSCFDPTLKTPTEENNSNAKNHPLCKPPCMELTCGERSKCNEQLNKNTPTKENNSYAQNHPLCKPPCRELTCGERSKCNEQLNKKTPTEVNTSEAASPAETKTPPLVPPLLKGYCTDSENCKVKTPDFQARVASSATIVLKSPCLGPGKCINNESLDPQTKCPGGCQKYTPQKT
ncbi:uncharacterized protein LOC134755049 [Cydia strobilella]|uniref:uncharacterized protein LOC134755049 n=1 Tax=Cydia strobilella TaxID=1100964 RepID=UPI003007ABBC